MVMIRPSLTLILDLDERVAGKETVLEVKRNYSYVCTPVVRTHATEEGEPIENIARMMVSMGTYTYLHSADEGADGRWDDIVEPWIGNMLHKVGSTMTAFNKRQRKIKLPELFFDVIEIALQAGELTVALRPDTESAIDPALKTQVGRVRALLNDGTFAGAVRVSLPSEESYAAQRDAAKAAWDAEHPEPEPAEDAEEEAEKAEEPAEPEPEKTREQLLAEDIEAKSYENTHVAPTDSNTLPPIPYEKEPEDPERFNFEIDYSVWGVEFSDGSRKSYDSGAGAFVA